MTPKSMARLFLSTLACGLSVSGAAFTNGSFETGANPGVFTTLSAGSTAITGWTVSAGTIDYIGSYWMPSDGARSIDPAGNGNGAISQTFDTANNEMYQLIFDLAGNPDGGPNPKNLQVSVGGTMKTFLFNTATACPNTVTGTGTMPSTLTNMCWATQTLNFTSDNTGSTTLTFTSANQMNTPYGPALDNVRLVDFGPAVGPSGAPEPTTAMLLGAGFLIVGVSARRRQVSAKRGRSDFPLSLS